MRARTSLTKTLVDTGNAKPKWLTVSAFQPFVVTTPLVGRRCGQLNIGHDLQVADSAVLQYPDLY
jgi:hypothetical protein